MSESAPRSNPRLDNFEANKLANEQAAFEAALYDQAGVSDFSDEAKNRVEEADAYERHLENLQNRPADFADDGYANPYMGNLHQDALDINNTLDSERYAKAAAYEFWISSLMQNDPHVRQMKMIAEDIARIGGTTDITADNDAQLAESLKDKQDRLEELLIKFSEESNYSKEDIDAITNRLINMTDVESVETGDDGTDEPGVDTTEPDADTPDAPKSDTVDNADVEPAPLDVTPDSVDGAEPAPLDVTPDAVDNDAEPAPLDVTPDAEPAPLEVTPDAKWSVGDIRRNPLGYFRKRTDALKERIEKRGGIKTREKALVYTGLGVLALTSLYLMTKGHDTSEVNAAGNDLGNTLAQNFSVGMTDVSDHVNSVADSISNMDVTSFSPDALSAGRGEGWISQLSQMGVSQDEIPSMLNKLENTTDPGIRDWVYQMRDGNPGIAKSGQIPTDVLQSIMKMRG